jgi:hypothetical protein
VLGDRHITMLLIKISGKQGAGCTATNHSQLQNSSLGENMIRGTRAHDFVRGSIAFTDR